MKTSVIPSSNRRRQAGYATLSVVAAISLSILSMLTYLLIGNIRSFDGQSRAQVKQDYSQKENAILSSLLHIVPNKAIGAMKEDSVDNANQFTWETIFSEAVNMANADQAADPVLLASLDLEDAISSNTGDTQFDNVYQFVNAPVGNEAGSTRAVNGGNWWEYLMLGNSGFGRNVPAALRVSYNNYKLDNKYPIVSFEKTYYDWYTKGLNVDPLAYPDFNLLNYPDVKFGYKRPGELFVAKRNWWVFSLEFGSHNEARTGIPSVKKSYVLSIYEIPSQLPLSSAATMKIGQFESGTDWRNISIDGGVNAGSIESAGQVALDRGAISARKTVTLNGAVTVEDREVANGFDGIGNREERALSSNSDFYDASTGGNVGKVAFIPINPGLDFVKRSSDGLRGSRISPTGWNEYSCGANRVKMRIEITEMQAADTQIPTKFKLHLRSESNSWMEQDYERGINWPTELEAGGGAFPFQSGELENLRNALIVHMDRLPAFLETIANAGHIDVNNSIHIAPVVGSTSIQIPSSPSLDSDMAVSLRGGKDLTAYTKGFSVLTDSRLYIAETLNAVKTTVPANSGLPAGADFYPPLSLFAPEKRFGESLTVVKPLRLSGQVGSLKIGIGDTFNPLELKSADESSLAAYNIDAELNSIRSPAELPPINLMNWLVTIEEIH